MKLIKFPRKLTGYPSHKMHMLVIVKLQKYCMRYSECTIKVIYIWGEYV